MIAYLLRRLLLTIPTLLGITLIVFTLTRFVPGGPIEKMMTNAQFASGDNSAHIVRDRASSSGTLDEKQLAELKAYYGFDKPVFVSYAQWLWRVLHLDLGYSTRYGEPVWDTVTSRMPLSLFYGGISLLITYAVCIPLGIVKALRHNSRFDHLSAALIFLGFAIPNYVLGILLITLFASHWEIFPLGGFASDDLADLSWTEQVRDIFMHAVLPLTTYLIGSFAVMTMLMKNSLLENLASDYVRTAVAKGLTFRQAVFRHALRNSLIPLATSFGHGISIILSGSFLVETIFNIDGMGLLGYESLVERDYPVVMGLLVISSLLFLIGNILSDLCVAAIDPRVRFE
ncbi:MAG TPA: ABC transporter permease subunit [Pseudomonadales bacterium]|jgi:microcin C transport system permease protein|nr:ABC transporter permease subunit [Pseudomonadales bacterium]HNI37101.1 ABC transporter permease subunit [Pseudomonadales bacterium]HNL91939.1 ABC transporter permease subunit [Pseudomonadales bacterium]HNN86510.1 ABC transporter permease subunit [Pseudomonadales bacterium]